MSLAKSTDPDYRSRRKTAMHVHKKTSPKRITVLEPNLDKRRISLDALLRRAARVTFSGSPLPEIVQEVINHYDGREVYLKTAASSPTYLHGELVKGSMYKGCYGIGLPDRTFVADNQPYAETLDIIVMPENESDSK